MTKKLLFVADLGHLRAYRLDDSVHFSKPRLELLEEWRTNVAKHLRQDVTDQAGQVRKGSTYSGPSDLSDGENHNLSLERRHRALKGLAKHMDQLVQREEAEECYLAAGSEINSAILEALNEHARSRIHKNIQANLTNVPSDELIKHFSE
jgi:hypothetical protein